MALDSVSQLGKFLGDFKARQETTKENITPNDTKDFIRIEKENAGTVWTSGTYILKKWEYESDAFIIDHPVQGELDSAVYKLDGGYTVASPTTIETGDLL